MGLFDDGGGSLPPCWPAGSGAEPSPPHSSPDCAPGAEHYGSAQADLADLLRTTGRLDEARAQLERGCAADEKGCWLFLGNLLADHLKDTVAAEAAYRAGISTGNVNCHHNLAMLLLEHDRTDAVLEHLRAGADAGNAIDDRTLREVLADRDDT